VYDGSRILAMEPTRLFVDAKTTQEWRAKGFNSVLNETQQEPEQNLQDSVLYHMLRLKQLNPQPRVGMLPESFDLGLDRQQECPTREEFDGYAANHPLWGMPYAMPNLDDGEYRTLVQWLAQGAPMPQESAKAMPAQIERWEQFLNGDSIKQRLVSRYLYEHLFIAHIHFADTRSREFYRLVRSHTPPGRPVDEIPTVRPYDDPGAGPFYYRFLKYHPGVVAKDHVVYELSEERMARYRELFLAPDYPVAELPTYEAAVASNPFKVFAAIPAESRYRFLLDDARFFIEGFIKGPVCRGQIALNVIEDHFWVMFFDPDRKTLALDEAFIDSMTDYLQLPSAEGGDSLRIFAAWSKYWELQKHYLEARQEHFKQLNTMDLEQSMDYVWNGNDSNPNAALTVFRHFDSASVAYGLVGDYPETAWIIDFPLLERIHYLLVAGFNVYGNVAHQLNTRLYMDFLRMEGEHGYLAFLPASHRRAIRDSWYQGIRSGMEEKLNAPLEWMTTELISGYRSDDPQRELYGQIERRLGPLARLDARLDCCGAGHCAKVNGSEGKNRVDRAMQRIAAMGGSHLTIFPDVSFVQVRTGDSADWPAYTLIRNKAYKSVTSMLDDETVRDSRDEEQDTLTVVNWLEGSYPNFFFTVDLEEIEAFADRYTAIRSRHDYEQFVGLYGVRRTNTAFWEIADWFHDQYAREKPVISGLFDLNRYRNR